MSGLSTPNKKRRQTFITLIAVLVAAFVFAWVVGVLGYGAMESLPSIGLPFVVAIGRAGVGIGFYAPTTPSVVALAPASAVIERPLGLLAQTLAVRIVDLFRSVERR